MMRFLIVLIVVLMPAAAQVGGIRIQPEREPKVRPLETIALQVRAYSSSAADSNRVRVAKGGGSMKVEPAGGGWVSKPFKFQGKDDDEAFGQSSNSRFGGILAAATRTYTVQDAFLYTAPEKPGKYKVIAELEGQTAELMIEVAADAPSVVPAEETTFEPSEGAYADPLRWLVEYWSPVLAQETWFQPKSDMPARFDFDGDWVGDNNWDNMEKGSSQAYVYYAASETPTHWFLTYNVFHPRDYSDKCVAGSCHENDNEGLILTVRKDGSEYGKLEVMETLAHNNVYSFVNDDRIRKNIHNVDGKVEFLDEHHPVVFIESGGHGIYGTTSSHARFDVSKIEFTGGTGITLVYKGVAEQPRHANDRNVGYELLPILDHWWRKGTSTAQWGQNTFDEFYTYEPFGNRPRVPQAAGNISGAFWGRKMASNKARPFWGWFDNATRKKRVLNTGQWALDPAYAVSQGLMFRGLDISMDYTYNPYLGVE